MTKVHVTSRRIFKDCRRKFYYGEIERLAPQSSGVNALWVGSGGHAALEHLYRTQLEQQRFPSFQEVWSDGWEAFVTRSQVTPNDEVVELMQGVLENYYNYAAENDHDWEIQAVESRINWPIPNYPDFQLTGAYDLIIRHKKWGGLWGVDHKFMTMMSDVKHLELDDQMTGYLWLAQKNQLKLRGWIYNCIRKKVPVDPEPLKSTGGLSKNKMQDTTYDKYYDAIVKYDLNPDDYLDMLEFLKLKENNFIQRTTITRSKGELQAFEDDLPFEVEDMFNIHGRSRYYPNPHGQCTWCPFQALCKVEREGSNSELMRRIEYRIKEDIER